jgi:ribosomal protein L40E
MPVICPLCSARLSAQATKCGVCGTAIPNLAPPSPAEVEPVAVPASVPIPTTAPKLFLCSDCGSSISTRADSCPKCGCNLRRSIWTRVPTCSAATIVGSLIGLSVIAILIASYVNQQRKQDELAEEVESSDIRIEISVFEACLNDPKYRANLSASDLLQFEDVVGKLRSADREWWARCNQYSHEKRERLIFERNAREQLPRKLENSIAQAMALNRTVRTLLKEMEPI